MNVLPWLFLGVGLFTMAGGVFNWDWFMNARKARSICAFLGRTGARVFYILFGLAFVVAGVLGLAGIVDFSR